MTTNSIHPYLAAPLARSRADELANEARAARRARLARRTRRSGRSAS
jgi:hypothetical protein